MDGQDFQNEQNNEVVTGDVVVENTSNSADTVYPYNTQSTQQVYAQVTEQPKEGNSALAVVSLVLGIISILIGCCYGLGILFAIPGIITAAISLKKNKNGLAIAGLVCSIVGGIYSIVMIVFYAQAIKLLLDDPSMMEEFSNLYDFSNL